MPDYTDAGLYRCRIIQMPDHTDAGLYRCRIIQVSDYTDAGLYRCRIIQVIYILEWLQLTFLVIISVIDSIIIEFSTLFLISCAMLKTVVLCLRPAVYTVCCSRKQNALNLNKYLKCDSKF